MPKIYLSPSTQESNPYITGSGSEEYNMNRLADGAVSLCQWHPLCAQHARHDRRVLHRAGEPPRRL